MEPPFHKFADLLRQLGLPDDSLAIERFIDKHGPIASHLKLAEAPFWNEAQSQFLREEIADDADWAELVDSLDASLRK